MKVNFKLIKDGNTHIAYHIDSNKFFKVNNFSEKLLEESMKKLDEELLISNTFKKITPEKKDRINKLTILGTSNCNLNCKYCFATYVQRKSKDNMSLETYIKSFDYILEKFPAGIEKIVIFGGEPLLSFDVFNKALKYYLSKCEEFNIKKPTIGIVSNGTILNDEIIDFFNTYNISLTISIDGNKEINDIFRVDNQSIGVYDRVVNNIKHNKEKIRFQTGIEVTLNKKHIQEYKEGLAKSWISDLLELGLDGITVGVVESKDSTIGLSKKDKDIYEKMYAEIIDYLFEELVNGRKFLPSDIINGIKALKSDTSIPLSCTAGLNNLTINTKGEVLPCYTFPSSSEFIMGDVMKKSSSNFNKIQQEFKNHFYNKPMECNTCWINNICNVWCRGLSYASNGDSSTILSPRCWTGKVLFDRLIINLVKIQTDKERAKQLRNNLRAINSKFSGISRYE